MFRRSDKAALPTAASTLPGRPDPLATEERHFVNGRALKPPFPKGVETILFGMGCFWGAERLFWSLEGVWVTSVGYSGGATPNPTYEEVCSGRTGHTEAVQVAFDPQVIGLADILRHFWENHDPTQGMRQGNDMGTQYRSAIYTNGAEQLDMAETSGRLFQTALQARGYGAITTEIALAGPYYYAEDYHQQYLAKNPQGYCGIGGTGVSCPIGLS